MSFSYQNIHRVNTVFFFLICILIVLFSREMGSYRGFVGDIVIVIFLYSFVQGLRKYPPGKLTFFLIGLSFIVEYLQYLKFGNIMGWNHIPIIKLIFGSVYDPMDLLAYLTGGMLTYIGDTLILRRINAIVE